MGLWLITVGSILIRGLRLVVVGSVRAVVESVLLPVVLWLITVGWTPVRGLRVVDVGVVVRGRGCVCVC